LGPWLTTRPALKARNDRRRLLLAILALLAALGPAHSAACSVNYQPDGFGNTMITEAHAGHGSHRQSAGAFDVWVASYVTAPAVRTAPPPIRFPPAASASRR